LLAVAAATIWLGALAGSAAAFPFGFQQQAGPYRAAHAPASKPARQRGIETASRAKGPVKAKEDADELAAKAKGVLSIAISIDHQQLTLYSDGQPIAHSRVSTGTPGHPTPTGVFSIIQKDRWHRSNIYYSAPMFYMQRITWSGVAMHQGVVPNQPASHGCIRLPEAFARRLWGTTKLGVRVLIARGEVTPAAISHARLFTVKQESPAEPKDEPPAAVPPSAEPSSADVVRAAHGALAASKPDPAIVSDGANAGSPALDAMAYAVGVQRETPLTSSEGVKPLSDGVEPAKRGQMRSGALGGGAEARPLKPGPISVFVSRREGKLFARKGFQPLFSMPVTVEQPDKPLGTHVFTALALNDDKTTMRWNVVTMPTGGGSARKAQRGGKSLRHDKEQKVEHPVPASTATEALDRINFPQEALDRISELLSPGASLIISDQGLGPETGEGTDFIVLTR
jgi:lipoprotein-anchoring transpeptidase ErfK/SrfK